MTQGRAIAGLHEHGLVAASGRIGISCPRCGSQKLSVRDSRPSSDSIRRRRKCLTCDHRFTSYEISDATIERYQELDALDQMVRQLTPHDVAVLRATIKAMMKESQ